MRNYRTGLIYSLFSFIILGSLFLYLKPVKATGVWSSGATGGEARSEFASVVSAGKIYNWGGNIQAISNSMDIYDIATNTWSTGATGGTARWGHTAVTYNDKIYYWGGNDDYNALNSLDIYDISHNSWSTGATGGTPRLWHSAVVVDGRIYFWGGVNNALEPIDSMNIYDIAGNSWTTGNPGGTARFSHSSIAYNGNIYNWGGSDASNRLNTLDIYNIAGNSWSTGATGGTARWEFFSATLYRGKIYNWGGDDANGDLLDTMDIYDIASNSWSTGTAGGTARKNYGSAAYNGKIYYFAGEKSVGVHLLARTNTVDIYDTFEQPLPEFNNLPGSDQPVNLTEGQTVTSENYAINVLPVSDFGIQKVEFLVDGNLLCTSLTADSNGIYTCNWDTTRYHSNINIVAYDTLGHTTNLSRQTNVVLASSKNNLPSVGVNLLVILTLTIFGSTISIGLIKLFSKI